MATEERDHTDDWIVPAERRPPSAFDLQRQIDVAMGVAYAAEEAVKEIGQASLEAAEQARLAAAHAERSAEAAVAAAASRPDPRPVLAPEEEIGGHEEIPGGHEEIPGSELPFAWSPVTPPEPRNGSDPVPAAARPARPPAQPEPFDERMVAFRRRAERVMARLERLEAAPPVS